MKRLHRYLPLLVLLLMLAAGVTSCHDAGHKREIRDALQRAETLMETDPHAARAVLDSIEIVNSKLSNRKSDLALYALLHRLSAGSGCHRG